MAGAASGGSTTAIFLHYGISAEEFYDVEIAGMYDGTDTYYFTITSEILTQFQPIKEGYEFLGWKLGQTESAINNPTDILQIGDVCYDARDHFTLNAVWKETTSPKKSRILFKSDTSSNWENQESTFQTLKGELYFYNDAIDIGKTNSSGNKVYKPKLKIGDGTTLSSLNFLTNEPISLPYIYALFNGVPNLVPFSTVSGGGEIYNSTGYKEGYRLSSNGDEKAQINSVVTGFIPATTRDIIRMSGVSWAPTVSSGYSYIAFYDANYTLLATINEYTGGTTNGVSNMSAGTVLNSSKTAHTITADSNGVYTFNLSYQDNASFSFIRISAEGTGSNMIVTKNEEILNTTNLLDSAILDSLILG